MKKERERSVSRWSLGSSFIERDPNQELTNWASNLLPLLHKCCPLSPSCWLLFKRRWSSKRSSHVPHRILQVRLHGTWTFTNKRQKGWWYDLMPCCNCSKSNSKSPEIIHSWCLFHFFLSQLCDNLHIQLYFPGPGPLWNPYLKSSNLMFHFSR